MTTDNNDSDISARDLVRRRLESINHELLHTQRKIACLQTKEECLQSQRKTLMEIHEAFAEETSS